MHTPRETRVGAPFTDRLAFSTVSIKAPEGRRTVAQGESASPGNSHAKESKPRRGGGVVAPWKRRHCVRRQAVSVAPSGASLYLPNLYSPGSQIRLTRDYSPPPRWG